MSSEKIKFFAGPFSSDAYMEGTFRHHIGVPNRLWPKQWMNLKRPNPYPKVVIIALCVCVMASLVKVNKKNQSSDERKLHPKQVIVIVYGLL